MPDIFLSYASADKKRAEVLKDWFEKLGWSVFWDRGVPVGERWEDHIQQQLDCATCVVVLWTPAGHKSDWVVREATRALETGRLIQLKCTALSAPPPFDAIQSLQFLAWGGEKEHAERSYLIKEVARRLGRDAPTEDVMDAMVSPPGVDRFQVASAVFNYCSEQIMFRQRQIAGAYQRREDLKGLTDAWDELKRVLDPISEDELHLLVDPFLMVLHPAEC